jgi:hypothetical protein
LERVGHAGAIKNLRGFGYAMDRAACDLVKRVAASEMEVVP